jgi:RNA polymerase sigma-70 factor (ECF subfamily)
VPLEDSELVLNAQNGDREAFGELVRRHHPNILRLCRALLQSDAQGDDAAQGAFIKVFHGLSGFHGDAAFSSWLRRIAYNHCLELLRKRQRERSESLEGLADKMGDAWQALGGTEPSPHAAAERRELTEFLLADLQPEWRLVLTLRELEGYNYEEISAKTGWSLDSVKARLRRARQALVEKARHFSDPPSI